MIKHGISDATARLLSSWQVLVIFSCSFQLHSDPAKLAVNVGSKCFIFITDMATGSADLSLGFSWLLPRPWLTSQPQAPGDICSLQIALNKYQVPLPKALSLGECNPRLMSATLSQRHQCLQPSLVKSFPRLNSSLEKWSPHTVSSLVLSRQRATLVNPLSLPTELWASSQFPRSVGFNWRQDENEKN